MSPVSVFARLGGTMIAGAAGMAAIALLSIAPSMAMAQVAGAASPPSTASN